MLNNNANLTCPFADELVSYVYDEFEAAQKAKFEAHLKTCVGCADELQSFQFLSQTVQDWRDEEFASLPTPLIEIPEMQTAKQAISSEEKLNFAEKFRKLFHFTPALTAATLLFAVISGAIVFYTLKFSNGNETAGINSNKIVEKPVVKPTAELEKSVAAKDTDDKQTPEKVSSPSEKNISPKENINKKSVAVPVKAVENVRKSTSDNSTVAPKVADDKKSPVKKQKVPSFNDEQDEDESIRLADLFEELDTK